MGDFRRVLKVLMLGRWVFSFFGEIKNFDEGKLGDQVKTKVIVYGNYTLWVQVLNHKYFFFIEFRPQKWQKFKLFLFNSALIFSL